MNGMEIISLIVAVSVLLKLIIFVFNPKWLKDYANSMIKKDIKLLPPILVVALFAIAYVVFRNLTIIEVFPAILIGHLMLGLLIIQYPKVYKIYVDEVFKDTSKTWLVWSVWVILSVWALYALFI